VLLEEPGHPEGLGMLADLYEKRGDVGEAVTLLSEALSSGEGAAAGEGRIALTRRLTELLREAEPEQAKEVYRSILSGTLPDPAAKRPLQAGLAALLTGEREQAERAALLEELLGSESGEEAATHALQLAELRARLDDEPGTRRALELGHRSCPDNQEVYQRLGQLYMDRQMWPEVVGLLLAEAERSSEPARKAKVLRGAARVQRERLRDDQGAAASLRKAVAASPEDTEVLRELTSTLVGAGDPHAAIAAVTEAVQAGRPRGRAGLLRLRAELHAGREDDAAAVTDLEEALATGDKDAAAELVQALSRVVARASAAGERPEARKATLRLAEVLRQAGEAAQSDQLLFRWIEANPDDREVLHDMRKRFEAEQRWDATASIWARLVHLEEGEAKAEAVLAMTDACEKIGRGGEAIPWLNVVLGHLPGHRGLRCRLADLLQANGRPADAARLRTEMADSEPDEGERHKLLVQAAQTLSEAGDWAAATVALEKAVALRPNERTSRALLVDACAAAGNPARASEILATLLAEAKTVRSEELATLYQRQAHLAAALGDADGHLQSLKKALDTDRKNVAIAAEVADVAETVGDDELALRALRIVAASPLKDPKASAMAYFRQGRIAHKARDKARAIIFLKRALQDDPDLAEARDLLEAMK
jgi:tetratricopeptide (TPR) repeat protein